MSRIHPSASDQNKNQYPLLDPDHHPYPHQLINIPITPTPTPTVLTVWKRSSMSFQGTDGFTVFDHHGGLAFRVDNYSRNTSTSNWSSVRPLVLMDGSGKPLLTLKPQMLSMQHEWNGYRGGEEDNGCGTSRWTKKSSSTNRVFTMRRSTWVLGRRHCQISSCEAQVFMEGGQGPDFRIQGSFWRRNCKIKDHSTGQVAAKIVRKRATATTTSTIMLSDDVFTLVVQPPFDPQLIMAFVVILDRICVKPFAPPLIIC